MRSISPGAVRGPALDWDDYKRRAALKIIGANPGASFTGPVPEPLRAIPVLQVHLNRDGTVRDIGVLRSPASWPEAAERAKEAIRRAAPFEPVGLLPPPWQFVETFLYDEDLRFALRSLVD